MDVLDVRKIRTQRQAVRKVTRGWLEDEAHRRARSRRSWDWHDEIAAVVHTRIQYPFPRSHMSYRVVYRRISGGVK